MVFRRVFLVLLTALAAAACAPESQQPQTAGPYGGESIETKIKVLRNLASVGDAEAEYNLGVLYAEGKVVPRDDVVAAEWFKRAAHRNYARAQYNLGVFFRDGRGVPNDDRLAFKWFSKAADQNDADAQNSMGNAYELGLGTPKDAVKAAEWYKRSADQGYPIAQFNLGRMYDDGFGVPQSDQLAFEWYERAANQGHALRAIYPCCVFRNRPLGRPRRQSRFQLVPTIG